MRIIPSPDQSAAVRGLLAALLTGHEAVLVGPAGTGKTTTLELFLAQWQKAENRPQNIRNPQPVCVCPTWKAALRFTQVTGWEAHSIHSLIYGAPEEKKDDKGRKTLEFNETKSSAELRNRLIVVDEASMVGERIYRDLMDWASRHNCIVLFVGDREQLEPVNAKWGVDFDRPTAALTKVHRQDDGSNLLDFVTLIREKKAHEFKAYGTDVHWHKRVDEPKLSHFWQSAETVSDRICITYTNRLRTGQNRIARRALGFSGDPQPGEPLLSFANRARMVNGEIVVINEIEEVQQGQDDPAGVLAAVLAPSELRVLQVTAAMGSKTTKFLLLPDSLHLFGYAKSDFNGDVIQAIKTEVAGELFFKYGRFMEKHQGRTGIRAKRILRAYTMLADVDYGYSVTAHKAQGSQWKDVFVLVEPALRKSDGGPAFRRRWLYTAATRAEKTLNVGSL